MDYYGRKTEARFQGAWGASNSFPTWASRLDNPKPDYDALCKSVPRYVALKLRDEMLATEDVDYVRQRMHANADDLYQNPERTVTLGAVIQVAHLAGEELLAAKLVEEDMKDLYEHVWEGSNDPDYDGDELREWLEHRQGLDHCPDIWKLLAKVKLGEALSVYESDVDAYVQEGCALIKQRSTQGPARSYASKTVNELVQSLDEAIHADRQDDGVGEDDPPSLLAPGATEAQLTALEERLATPLEADGDEKWVMLPWGKLPEDYKDFLRASNGFPADGSLFSPADEVAPDDELVPDCDWLHDMEYTLFPDDREYIHGSDPDQELDNIPLGEYTCFTIGTGDREGVVTLIPPNSVRPIVERFEKAYAEANEQIKRVYERAALDLYGGLANLRKLEWLCLEFQHSAYEQRIWGGLRPYLEEYVKRSVDEREEGWRKSTRGRRKKSEKRKREESTTKGTSGESAVGHESKAQRTD
jgi:hypothetical protein